MSTSLDGSARPVALEPKTDTLERGQRTCGRGRASNQVTAVSGAHEQAAKGPLAAYASVRDRTSAG